jgi:hypothetical protein
MAATNEITSALLNAVKAVTAAETRTEQQRARLLAEAALELAEGRPTANTPTSAGEKLLREFLTREARGQLRGMRDGCGAPLPDGMPLPHGDGAALSAAQKLTRDGYARLVGGRHRRHLIITDAGRAAVLMLDTLRAIAVNPHADPEDRNAARAAIAKAEG